MLQFSFTVHVPPQLTDILCNPPCHRLLLGPIFVSPWQFRLMSSLLQLIRHPTTVHIEGQWYPQYTCYLNKDMIIQVIPLITLGVQEIINNITPPSDESA